MMPQSGTLGETGFCLGTTVHDAIKNKLVYDEADFWRVIDNWPVMFVSIDSSPFHSYFVSVRRSYIPILLCKY